MKEVTFNKKEIIEELVTHKLKDCLLLSSPKSGCYRFFKLFNLV